MDVGRKRCCSAARPGPVCYPKRLKATSLEIPTADASRLFEDAGAAAVQSSALPLLPSPATMPSASGVPEAHPLLEMALLSPQPASSLQAFGNMADAAHAAAPDAPQEGGMDPLEALPEVLALKVFQKVPPQDIARKCALISTSWARLARSQELWKGFCSKWGLTYRDASAVLGGYRGLFALVFGSNLVQCPSFERIHHSESPGDTDTYYDSGPFTPSAKLLVERIMGLGEVDQEYSARSHWGADGEGAQSIFDRGGVNSLYRTRVTGLFQEPGPVQDHEASCGCSCALPNSTPAATAADSDTEVARQPENAEAVLRGDDPAASTETPSDLEGDSSANSARESSIISEAVGADASQASGVHPRESEAETERERSAAESLPSEPAMVVQDEPGSAEGLAGICPCTAAKPPPVGSDAVCTSSCTWGCLKQAISLRHFCPTFLDRCPPLHLSAWCASNGGSMEHRNGSDGTGLFRMQVIMLGRDKQPVYHWDSKEVPSKSNKWRQASVLIQDYPQGVRSVIVKVAGRGVCFSKTRASFSFGQ